MSMDISKVGTLDSGVGRLQPGAERSTSGASFRETLADLERNQSSNNSPARSGIEKLKFSNHAIDRMRSRGVSFTPEQMQRLQSAVEKAAAKGGRDSLVLMNDTAVIVSVKNNTVVTVVDKASLKENVFTNIDSTIVI